MRKFMVFPTFALSVASMLSLQMPIGNTWSRQEQLSMVKAVTTQYQDPATAVADGYVAEPLCVAVPGQGAMGIHYKNQTLIGDNMLDPMKPEALVYIPDTSGQLRLVAFEYVVPAMANTDNGSSLWSESYLPPMGWQTATPALFGKKFVGPMPGNVAGDPWNYQLHVWVGERNPAGTFAQFNPNLSCPSV